jgi:Zn finger protein HypA/HybF involved in hydrogenase expression
MERPGVKIDRNKIADLTELGQREYIEGLQIVYEEASKILDRDITPLSFVLLLERIADRNPELRAYSSTSQATKDKNFGVMREWAKAEAGRLTKVWGIDGLEAKMLSSKYTDLLGRKGTKRGEASYDVTIPGQLGLLIKEMGVPTEKTPTGKVATGREVLDKITEKYAEEFPFLKRVRRFREIDRTLCVYLYYLYEDMKLRWICRDCHRHSAPSHPTKGTPPTDGKCNHCQSTNIHREDRVRVQFRGHKVDTGRFAVKAGKNPARDGVCRVPFQGFPNQYDEERPECMRRMRETVIPDEGFTIVAIDFDGVELRIVTNLSREPKWMAEYFRCSDCGHQFGQDEFVPPFCPKCKSSAIGDLHTLTALGVYGENARQGKNWKRKRQAGKNTNFSLCYGGSWKAVQRQTQCSEREAKRIKDKFDGMYKTLPAWWRKTRAFAKRRGYVLTAERYQQSRSGELGGHHEAGDGHRLQEVQGARVDRPDEPPEGQSSDVDHVARRARVRDRQRHPRRSD